MRKIPLVEGLQINVSGINLLSISILKFLGIFSLKGMLSITTDKIANEIVVFLFHKQNISCGVLIGHVSLRGFQWAQHQMFSLSNIRKILPIIFSVGKAPVFQCYVS